MIQEVKEMIPPIDSGPLPFLENGKFQKYMGKVPTAYIWKSGFQK